MTESPRPPDRLVRMLAARACQPWAVKPDALYGFLAAVADLPATNQEIEDYAPVAVLPPLEIMDDVAVVRIAGIMWKGAPRILVRLGMATDTAVAAELVTRAADDADVRGILLEIDSPGGLMYGVQELADAILAARDAKPIVAHADDLCCSAAYLAASQAHVVLANRSSIVGSIGTFMVIDDWNRMLLNIGVDTRIVKSALLKGGDASGSAVTESELADAQRVVDDINAQFIEAVARGRGAAVDDVAALATGQVWLAPEALRLGLVDAAANANAALERASQPVTPGGTEYRAESQNGGPTMSLFGRRKQASAESAQDSPGAAQAEESQDPQDPQTQEGDAGSLTVTLVPQEAVDAGAAWRVDDGEWQESGATLELAAGEYRVSYQSVEGWTAPAEESVSLEAGQALAVEREYTDASAEEESSENEADETADADPDAPEAAAPMTAAQALKLAATVGAEKALEAQAAGQSVEQALLDHAAVLQQRLDAQSTAIDGTEALGSETAVPVGAADEKRRDGKPTAAAGDSRDLIGEAADAIKAKRNTNRI